jgi:hypothetical protein
MDISNKSAFLVGLFLNFIGFALNRLGIEVLVLPLLISSIIGIVAVFLKNYLDAKCRIHRQEPGPDKNKPNQTDLIAEVQGNEVAINVLLAIKELQDDNQETSETLGQPIRILESEISKKTGVSLALVRYWISKLTQAGFLLAGFGEVYGVSQCGLGCLLESGRIQ